MLPRSSLGFYLSPPNPQGSLYCPCSRILSLPVRWLFGSLNSLLFFVTDLNTFEKRYFIVASTRYGESPIVSQNSSTIRLVSFRPLANASSGAGYVNPSAHKQHDAICVHSSNHESNHCTQKAFWKTVKV
ncbi:hypothetical protein BYT27DRAFT_7186396, partial [Phlegmacium glaucopus]